MVKDTNDEYRVIVVPVKNTMLSAGQAARSVFKFSYDHTEGGELAQPV
jgi:hypothetical protein